MNLYNDSEQAVTSFLTQAASDEMQDKTEMDSTINEFLMDIINILYFDIVNNDNLSSSFSSSSSKNNIIKTVTSENWWPKYS